jgi:hypothetical protein
MKIATAATLALAFSASAIAMGCKSSGDDDDTGKNTVDSGSPPMNMDVKCPADTPVFTATPETGLEATVTHKTLRVRAISADPVHPTKNAENNWTIQFMDDQGAPLDGVKIDNACAFMPVHGHGTAPLGGTKALPDPGQFELDFLNFIMRGPWQVELAVTPASTASGDAGSGDMDASTEPAPTTREYTHCDRMRAHPGTEFAVFNFCVAN